MPKNNILPRNLIITFINFSSYKNILGVLNIDDDMYLLITSKGNKYAALKIIDINNISSSIFYEVRIYADNKKYISSHTQEKISEHGINDIEKVINGLYGNIRDIKLELRKNTNYYQNYLLVYIPIDYAETNINYKYESNKDKFRAKYKIHLNLHKKNDNDKIIDFYVPTIHSISKDDKKDIIIC
ncbi:hypothetical protein [Brachyspira innocens]|uniref:hypothetical protein n=1 Tax=Brachyspira innocens TaxID=13264 RepID=UPI0012E9B411|nr:hypothetical protein [Brachyspira innocens]